MVNFTSLGFCNSTLEHQAINDAPIWHGYSFYQIGLVICAAFGLFAIIMSVYLMVMHATHYSRPEEQKHIIRILFMVPVYSLVSFLSYYYYAHTLYYQVLRDCYEAFAIASFFSLMCAFIAPDLHEQKEYFRGIRPRIWVWPLTWGNFRIIKNPPRSGLTWFNIVFFCVFQYCFIRVFMTIVAVVTEALGRYCIDSLSPAFAHVWVTCIEGAAVSVAMYAIIQFFIQLRGDITEHKPGIKVASIKLVIFFSFWQTLIIDFLVSSGALKATATISSNDFRVGLPDMLLCIEMAIFSILHLFAYPWRTYDVTRSPRFVAESAPGFDQDPKTAYKGGFMGYKAFLQAYNFWDIIKATARGVRWMFVGRKYREQDSSYQVKRGDQGFAGTSLEDHGDGTKPAGKYTKLNDPLLAGNGRSDSPERAPAYGMGGGGGGSGEAYDMKTQQPYTAYNAQSQGYGDQQAYGDQSHAYEGQAPGYGGKSQAYGVTHPSQRPSSRPGTSGGGGQPIPPAGTFGYPQDTSYGGSYGQGPAEAPRYGDAHLPGGQF